MISRVILLSLLALLGSNVVAAMPGPPARNSEGCPAVKPDEEATCGGLPDQTRCNYDYTTCPGGGPGIFTSFCTCANDMFFCGRARPCASLYTTFPSAAPSVAPVAAAAAAATSAEEEEDIPWTWTTPSWVADVKAANPDKKVKYCKRKEFPPLDGETCSSRRKSCYWGEQKCGTSTYPTTGCDCDKLTWTCDTALSCPSA